MKKILVLALVVVMALGLGGCAKKAKQEALLQYIDYDMTELTILYDEMITSYNGVVSKNHINDAVSYKEFRDNTKGKAEAALKEAREVAATIEDDELANIHNIFVEYLIGFDEALDMAIKLIEDTRPDQVEAVNKKLRELEAMRNEYQNKLVEYGKECDIEVTFSVVK